MVLQKGTQNKQAVELNFLFKQHAEYAMTHSVV